MERPSATGLHGPSKTTRVDLHPAVGAWRKVANGTIAPENIEILQERPGKAEIYRLPGVGPGGAAVVAKRCSVESGRTERLIYQEILPNLPLSALKYHGFVTEEEGRSCWLFLEDAGNENYDADLEEHRVLAGHWLGTMNTFAQSVPVARSLPDRGPRSYLELLKLAREEVLAVLDNSRVSSDGSSLLTDIVSHCDDVAKRWHHVDHFCEAMPRTVVHGDFAIQNARIRTCPAGTSLLVMDWEGTGWGVPAADLSRTTWSLRPDLTAYWSVVRSFWPHVALADLHQWVQVGRVFRLISSLAWLNSGFARGGVEWYVEDMHYYEPKFAAWLRAAKAWDE
jgi:phosphotransferase family enzyme